MTNNSHNCDEKDMKIKFNSDDLPLKETLELHNMVIVARYVLMKTANITHKFSKCYILIELTFLKILMLIRQVHQKSVLFATVGIS